MDNAPDPRVALADRRTQLEGLIRSLQALIELLSLDRQCQWTPHFERCLNEAELLAGKGFDQQQLNGLSGSVMSVFGGMGSFNDYAPFRAGRLIRGMESLDAVSGQVYAAALSLRVVNRQASCIRST